MKIKGEYRDILSKNGEVMVDTGWKSNDIVEDYGRFLAALMKKDFKQKVGIDYMAVGSGSNDDAEFKSKVKTFFDSNRPNELPEPTSKDNWVWAKKIEDKHINYLDVVDESTNKLKIDVKIEKNEPSEGTFDFKEFALLGIDKEGGKFVPGEMFFINYVDHGLITKDEKMELTRTIKLTFLLGENEEGVT